MTADQRAACAARARALSADPEIVAKRTAAMCATLADPVKRENHRQAARRGVLRKMEEDPSYRARMTALGNRYGRVNLIKAQAPEPRARAAQSIRARALEWCPEEFWPLNRTLKRKGFKLAERKAIILAEVPGTEEHARRAVQNAAVAGKLRHAREVAQRY